MLGTICEDVAQMKPVVDAVAQGVAAVAQEVAAVAPALAGLAADMRDANEKMDTSLAMLKADNADKMKRRRQQLERDIADCDEEEAQAPLRRRVQQAQEQVLATTVANAVVNAMAVAPPPVAAPPVAAAPVATSARSALRPTTRGNGVSAPTISSIKKTVRR